MTKRVKMSEPQRTEPPRRSSLWPFIITGAAAGVIWSAIDPDTFRESAADFAQFVGSTVQPLFDNLLSLLRSGSGAA
jgi:hypothetical protein